MSLNDFVGLALMLVLGGSGATIFVCGAILMVRRVMRDFQA